MKNILFCIIWKCKKLQEKRFSAKSFGYMRFGFRVFACDKSHRCLYFCSLYIEEKWKYSYLKLFDPIGIRGDRSRSICTAPVWHALSWHFVPRYPGECLNDVNRQPGPSDIFKSWHLEADSIIQLICATPLLGRLQLSRVKSEEIEAGNNFTKEIFVRRNLCWERLASFSN